MFPPPSFYDFSLKKFMRLPPSFAVARNDAEASIHESIGFIKSIMAGRQSLKKKVKAYLKPDTGDV